MRTRDYIGRQASSLSLTLRNSAFPLRNSVEQLYKELAITQSFTKKTQSFTEMIKLLPAKLPANLIGTKFKC